MENTIIALGSVHRPKHLLRLRSLHMYLLRISDNALLTVILVDSDKRWAWKFWKHFTYSVLYLTLLTYAVLFYIPVSPETQTNIKD